MNTQDRNSKEALRSIQLGFRLHNSLRDEPSMIAQLVRVSILAIDSRSLNDYLKEGSISEVQAKQLFSTLASIDVNHGYIRALQGERAYFIYRMNAPYNSIFYPSSAEEDPDCIIPEMIIGYVYEKAMFKADAAAYIHFMGEQIKIIPLSYKELNSKHVYDESDIPFYAILTRILAPVQSDARRHMANAQLAGDQIILALQAYKERYGTYPQSISELKGKLGWKLPKDTYSDKDFLYRRQGKGFILYSVGPNMKDDGGVQRSKKYFDYRETGDFVWTMDH